MDTGLEKAIEAAGGTGALANLLGTTVQVVSNWKRRGAVPPERCLAIETALQGRVTAQDLRPDIFGAAAQLVPSGFEQALGELAGVLRDEEHTRLALAFDRGPQHLIREIESLELTLDVRAQLLAAAQAGEGMVG